MGKSIFDVISGNDPYANMMNQPTPAMPSFLSNLGPDGKLLAQYQLGAQPGLDFHSTMGDENSRLAALPQLNNDPLHALEAFSQSGSSNPWVDAQMQAEELQKGKAMGAATSSAQAGGAAAADQMAARGGLNSGAMERIATNTGNNISSGKQGVQGQDLAAKAGIQQQNVQNQLGVMENLPGQEVQALQPGLQTQSLWQQAAGQNQQAQQQLEEQQQQYKTGVNQFNIQNAEQGLNAQNQFNLQSYANQIAGQAGKEQAWATANAGKK
jgi:hypothetical protein